MKLHDKYLKTEKRRLLQPLWNEFAKHLLPFKDEGICLAVSGGADSRALLESLACDPKRSQYKYLHVVIVDHGHRVQASAEASHLYQRAVRLGFNSEIKTIENNMKNTANEAILRDYRYDALWQIAKKHGCKCLCTAHHGNDNAEGFIMDFLGLGGGQDGAAMLAVAEVEDGKILRPFTYLKSSQLRLALLALGIKVYVQDEADARCEGARAQIRNVVFPFLQQLYPSAISRAFKESVSRQEKISKAHQLCAEYETKVIFRDNNTVFIKYLQNISI